jgi:CTP synthase (UTP-ammonia lyase)
VADPLQIGILGDYDPASSTLPAVERSIKHAAEKLKVAAEVQWLATESLLTADLENKLEAFDALWAGPGSPYKSFDGMLRGIEFARRRDWPFVGT